MNANGEWMRTTAEAVILRLLSRKPMYGYEMIKTVNEKTNGLFEWKEGSLYPCLHKLEQAGMLESFWENSPENKPRKYYRLTASGCRAAATKVKETQRFCNALEALLAL